MKRKLKLLVLLLTVVLSIGMFSGCFFVASLIEEAVNNPEEALEIVGEPTITCVYNEEYKQYDVTVDGIVKNNSEDKWEWVNITVMLYDAEDNALGSAYGYIDYIEANGTWRFRATAMTSYEATSAKAYDFSGTKNSIF